MAKILLQLLLLMLKNFYGFLWLFIAKTFMAKTLLRLLLLMLKNFYGFFMAKTLLKL
jgi:hypothetical protein